MSKKYVKRLIPIEALEWTGENFDQIYKWAGQDVGFVDEIIFVDTLEGRMSAKVGDYLIKGIRGELYFCDKEIFEESYEEYVD